MADTKISALTASTTPLAGTEVLPIVQSGTTKQVSVANLTAGRAVSAAEMTLSTGNLVIGTSGKGIDFSATPGTGTSELLSDYEEGTWTPTMTSAAGVTTVNTSAGRYTKIGDHVFVLYRIDYSTDASVATSNFTIGGLPFTSRSSLASRGFVTGSNFTGGDFNDGYMTIGNATTNIVWAGRSINQNSRTNAILLFCADYFAA
jgi:hypothetical protein